MSFCWSPYRAKRWKAWQLCRVRDYFLFNDTFHRKAAFSLYLYLSFSPPVSRHPFSHFSLFYTLKCFGLPYAANNLFQLCLACNVLKLLQQVHINAVFGGKVIFRRDAHDSCIFLLNTSGWSKSLAKWLTCEWVKR